MSRASDRPITRRQHQALAFIREYIETYEYSPTYAEICNALGVKSLATVHKHVKGLEAKGYIERPHGGRRDMVLKDFEGELTSWMIRQREFSLRTFGPGRRALGIVRHIEKELQEIDRAPEDLMEWTDVIILAADGFWRAGGNPQDLIAYLNAKQQRNIGRTWPAVISEDLPVEHDRSHETVTEVPSAGV